MIKNINSKMTTNSKLSITEPQQRQPRASRRKEITKIRAELNDIETKNTILRINKYRSWFFKKINKSTSP